MYDIIKENISVLDYYIFTTFKVPYTPIYLNKEQLKYLEGMDIAIFNFNKKEIIFTNQKPKQKNNNVRVLKLKKLQKGYVFHLFVSPAFLLKNKYLFIDLKNKKFEIFDDFENANKFIVNNILDEILSDAAKKQLKEKLKDDEYKKIYNNIIKYKPESEKRSITIKLIFSKVILILNLFFKISRNQILASDIFKISETTCRKIIKNIKKHINLL